MNKLPDPSALVERVIDVMHKPPITGQEIRSVTLTVELRPEQAAALKWIAEKLTHDDCMQYTYAHRPKDERIERAYEMLDALREMEKALDHVRSWPWIETGRVR